MPQIAKEKGKRQRAENEGAVVVNRSGWCIRVNDLCGGGGAVVIGFPTGRGKRARARNSEAEEEEEKSLRRGEKRGEKKGDRSAGKGRVTRPAVMRWVFVFLNDEEMMMMCFCKGDDSSFLALETTNTCSLPIDIFHDRIEARHLQSKEFLFTHIQLNRH
ncbi:hypothetical protein E3N88_17040 [Mikania micrantha]|uniref:Uncharacterized protein n=1 Tax=Mikania micrantha TaxID=192012 RepID=A0A5N6NR97_9ASTR|nr:hypothetical protein E3N88_17040 [Mikania micrantha]